MKLQPLKFTLAAIAAALLVLVNAAPADGYSYAEKEDPVSVLFKSAVVAAREGRWDDVSDMAVKGIEMQKGHIFQADSLAPLFDSAIAAKNVSKTAETFANLLYISIREKLHQSLNEDLKHYKNAKARLGLARKSYMDVLDGNVKKKDADRSRLIIEQFNAALKGIGNPGLFGIGKLKPDPAAYREAVKAIESLVIKSFPSFAG
ncbi:MAG: hypothetical protein IEMM0002_0259 [bacterium]|nr:MAG: hypothetical protein IEMM0002_0259 [bacterium]